MASFKGMVISTCILYGVVLLLIKLYLKLVENGFGVPVLNHYPGKCRVVPGIECGSEDFAVTRDGLVFISNGLRVIPKCDPKINKGSIYLFDFQNPNKNVTRLEIISEEIDFDEFDPHGLSLWEDEVSGSISLFMIEHVGKEKVLIFEYKKEDPYKLIHKDTIMDPSFVCVNDLVATGPRSFYITNFIAFCKFGDLGIMFEFFTGLPTGSVVYFDGRQGNAVAKGLQMSNGINISPDGRHIFVASGSSRQVLIYYRRDQEDGSLKLVKVVDLLTSPDNIEVDKDSGDLYIGCHKNYRLPFSQYNGTFAAPSQVMRVRPKNTKRNDVSVIELLSSDGLDFVRGSSVASYYKGGLLVGTVFHRLAYCENVNVP